MITSLNDLELIQQQQLPLIEARLGKDTPAGEYQILVCAGTGCSSGGSHGGYIYVRAEYPIAVDRLERAIRQARRAGLLGQNILGSGFDFDVDIRLGAGAPGVFPGRILRPLHPLPGGHQTPAGDLKTHHLRCW
ncbi:hypothetical protein hamaS1_17910 [Moorella sp. Hama-1]|uniref:hypothetical protein n=1 Tax=Moorella sp. Hama-1 TaxID=2138101 RepID=UPI00204927BE|nr:hypothetical protein [Moorella sp. Hama-1]BCV21722.1 hypothetical protein hamaS1_17910 [Moorella sp. Hama-1]